MSADLLPLLDEVDLLAGLQILIVEDHADAAYLYQIMLELQGAKVRTTNRVHLAWAMLETEKFDVLLTEIALPGETGLSLLKQLRAREAKDGGYIPAIAMTGRFSHATKDQLEQELLSVGFQAFLPKPITAEELVGAVIRLTQPQAGSSIGNIEVWNGTAGAVIRLTQPQAGSHPTLVQQKDIGEGGA